MNEDIDAFLKQPLPELEFTILIAVLLAKKMRLKAFSHGEHGAWRATLNTGEEITLSPDVIGQAGAFMKRSVERWAEWQREEETAA
jgi:hypothetical protein